MAMPVETLEDLFVRQLEELYYVESRLVDVLGELAADAENDTLREGFRDHQEETRTHVERVERVFDALGRQPDRRESRVLEALVDEREAFREDAANEELRDLFDMQAGMKTERIEMTSYQGLLSLAKKLDYGDDVTEPLEDNLSDERSAFRELEGLTQGSKLKSVVGQLMG